MIVIADASCLIALLNIGRIDLLQQIYGQIVTTRMVAAEVGQKLPEWISITEILDEEFHRSTRQLLDPGEASAIALAREVSEPLLVLDDLAARKFAERLGLRIIGTLGILEDAKIRGIVPEVKPLLDALKRVNFRVSKTLEERVLRKAGEL